MKKAAKRKASKITAKTHSKHKPGLLKNMGKVVGGSASYWASNTSRFNEEN